jgi:hypothetical protein
VMVFIHEYRLCAVNHVLLRLRHSGAPSSAL